MAAAVFVGLMLTGIHGASAGETARASKVDIADFAFTPATLTVAKGGQVTFANSSPVAHTATRAGAFDSGRIKPGKSVTVRFKQRGTFPCHCTIHPSMRGKIVVN